MTLDSFQLLLPEVQLHHVRTRGTLLAWRWTGDFPTILHYLPNAGRGFYVELGVNAEQTHFVVLHSFSDSKALAEYAQGVRLPGE